MMQDGPQETIGCQIHGCRKIEPDSSKPMESATQSGDPYEVASDQETQATELTKEEVYP